MKRHIHDHRAYRPKKKPGHKRIAGLLWEWLKGWLKHRGAWQRWKLLVDLVGKFYCSYACLRAAHPFCRECRQPIRRAS